MEIHRLLADKPHAPKSDAYEKSELRKIAREEPVPSTDNAKTEQAPKSREQAVLAVLDKMGLHSNANKAMKAPPAGEVAAENKSRGGTVASKTSAQKVMHDLFSALRELREQNVSPDKLDAKLQQGYADFGSDIRALMEQLGNKANRNDSLSQLQYDFQSLALAVQQTSGSVLSNSASTPTLEDFLSNLLNHVSQQGTPLSSVGNLIEAKG